MKHYAIRIIFEGADNRPKLWRLLLVLMVVLVVLVVVYFLGGETGRMRSRTLICAGLPTNPCLTPSWVLDRLI